MPDGQPVTLETYTDSDWKQTFQPGDLVHGIVMQVSAEHAVVRFGDTTVRVTPPGFCLDQEDPGRPTFSLPATWTCLK